LPEFSIFSLGLVLLTASLVAIVSRRLKLPYSVGLVIAGITLALIPNAIELPLTRDLIFNIFLPPLIFEAALHLEWKAFRRDLPLTAGLAFPGVLIAAIAVSGGMHFLIGWSWIGAALFGVLIAATDPVSVIASFREMKVERRLSMLVEAESLLNDGAAAVGFALLVAIAAGDGVTPVALVGSLLWTVAGGVVAGLVVSGGLLIVAGRTEDHLVEITLTTLAAYGSFLLAEHFHMSGVLASLSAGLLVGNFGMMRSISENSRSHVFAFWEYAAFLANSVVFILIGSHEAHQHLTDVVGAAAVAIVLVLAGRALVFLGAPVIERLQSNASLSGALAAVTASIVGVIANLAVWFALHVLFRNHAALGVGPFTVDLPVLASVDLAALALAICAAICLFRLKRGVLQTLGITAVAGLILRLALDV
jgi:monovalent cation:H+ antiporter, CPA1 family